MPETAWTKIDVRDGEKGPLEVELAKFRVQVKSEGRHAGEETLVLSRRRDEAGNVTHDDFSNAPFTTDLREFARVAKAEHRLEDRLKRGKSEAGLADDEVRSWPGWHHHQTLSLLAAWFLHQETRREKKSTPAMTVPQLRMLIAKWLRAASGCDQPAPIARECTERLQRNQLAKFHHYQRRNLLAPLPSKQRLN